jgi:DNA polymerase III subunit beta
MHFFVERDLMRQEMSITQAIVEKKTTVAILVNVLLRVDKNTLQLTATDLDVTYHAKLPVEVKKEGGATVLASKLAEIFALLPENRVEMKLKDNGRLLISSGAVNYELAILPPEDYPKVPRCDDGHGIKVAYELLQKGMVRTIPSVSMDEYRYQLGGVCFKMAEGKLELASTDGHRLNRVILPAEVEKGYVFPEGIVPRKACHELTKMDGEDTCHVGHQDQFITFRFKNRELIARKLQNKFPDYTSYVTQFGEKDLVIERDALFEAVRRVSILGSGKYYGIRFFINTGKLKLDGSHPDIGEAIETLEIDYKGEPMQIGFNSKYLLDFLNSIAAGPIKMHLKDSNSKGVFLPQDASIDHVYVLMPMTL